MWEGGDMENERLSKLVEAAKGERSIREYSADSGVNPTTISKIISKGYTPSSGVIKKLGSPEARPRGNVTLQDLMIAAGYSEDYIKTDILVDMGQGREEFVEVAGTERARARQEESFRTYMQLVRRFETMASGAIYTGLAKKGIMFTPGQNVELAVRGYRPDIFIKLQSGSLKEWWFDFRKIRSNEDGKHVPIRMHVRQSLGRYVLLEPDKNRKLSIVVDDEEFFDAIISYKGKTSYRGDLSVILIDTDELCILKEEYIAFYELDDDEDNKIKLI